MTLEAALRRTASSGVLVHDTFNASAAGASSSSAAAGTTVSSSRFFGSAAPAEMVALAASQAEGEKSARQLVAVRKKRRRRGPQRSAEDAESQRLAHIAVERNRRRQMNEYLAALRSLLPGSYVHRSDQASVVSGSIDFVKELEQQLQSLEAHKLALQRQQQQQRSDDTAAEPEPERDAAQPPAAGRREDPNASAGGDASETEPAPFARFFRYPQYAWRHRAHAAAAEEEEGSAAVADVEVGVVVDAHARLRVMAPRRGGQLLRMVAGLQALGFAVLHLNVATALGDTALYTFSLKVEEGCGLTTEEDIAAAAHHVLRIIDDEAKTQRLLAAGASRQQQAAAPPGL